MLVYQHSPNTTMSVAVGTASVNDSMHDGFGGRRSRCMKAALEMSALQVVMQGGVPPILNFLMLLAGIAGGAPGTGASNNPATVGSLYSPANPVGSRWSALADSLIARLYHSSAFLTQNAEVSLAYHNFSESIRRSISQSFSI